MRLLKVGKHLKSKTSTKRENPSPEITVRRVCNYPSLRALGYIIHYTNTIMNYKYVLRRKIIYSNKAVPILYGRHSCPFKATGNNLKKAVRPVRRYSKAKLHVRKTKQPIDTAIKFMHYYNKVFLQKNRLLLAKGNDALKNHLIYHLTAPPTYGNDTGKGMSQNSFAVLPTGYSFPKKRDIHS